MKTIILVISLVWGLWQGIEMLGNNIKAGVQTDRILKADIVDDTRACFPNCQVGKHTG